MAKLPGSDLLLTIKCFLTNVPSTQPHNPSVSHLLLNHSRYIYLLFYWLVLNALVFWNPATIFPNPKGATLSNVSVISNVNETLPPEDSNWQAVTLPDNWSKRSVDSEQLWYRGEVVLDTVTQQPWGIYLPHVTHNAEVFVNGTWVGSGGRFSTPIARNQNRPLFFAFSHQLLKPTRNEIVIRVKSIHPSQGLLDTVYLAPQSQLQSHYQWKYWLRVKLVTWTNLFMYVIAGLVFFIWLVRRQDQSYGIFALLLFTWASHNLNLVVRDIPVPTRLWEAFSASTLGWAIAIMIIFNHRYTEYHNPKIEKFILLSSLLGLVIFLLPTTESVLLAGYRLWDSLLILFGSYAILQLLRAYAKTRALDIWLMLLVGMPILVCGFHDILLVNHLRDRREGLIIQYSAIPAMLLFSWFMLNRFIQSLAKAEQLTNTLERQVQEREQKIRQQLSEITKMEQDRLLNSERERIMRDMHDGIGGQLMSLSRLLDTQDGPVFSTAKEKTKQSLRDLRLVIDSLDPVLSNLTTLIGILRSRLQEQLDEACIDLRWEVDDPLKAREISPSENLHIMRIVQEAITNVIKHSKATTLTFSVRQIETSQQESIELAIVDNGVGCSATKGHTNNFSRGITNMNYRADQIGAQLQITSCDKGTAVTITLAGISNRSLDH